MCINLCDIVIKYCDANNSCHLLNIYCLPDTFLKILHVSSYLRFTKTIRAKQAIETYSVCGLTLQKRC